LPNLAPPLGKRPHSDAEPPVAEQSDTIVIEFVAIMLLERHTLDKVYGFLNNPVPVPLSTQKRP
jgi:hypothetical protein